MQPDHAHIAPLKNLLRSHFGLARENLNFYGLLLLLLDMMQPDEPDAIKSSRQDWSITTATRSWRDQRTEKFKVAWISHAFGWLTWSTHLLNHFSPSLSTRRPLIKRKYRNHFSELQSGRVTDLDFQCSIRSLDWWSRVNINDRNVSGKGGSIPRP